MIRIFLSNLIKYCLKPIYYTESENTYERFSKKAKNIFQIFNMMSIFTECNQQYHQVSSTSIRRDRVILLFVSRSKRVIGSKKSPAFVDLPSVSSMTIFPHIEETLMISVLR